MLDDLEKRAKDDEDEGAFNAVKECRSSLDKLISRMDNMEPVYDRIAERLSRWSRDLSVRRNADADSVLSNSRLSSSRRRGMVERVLLV
jgi:autophagy-related protein 11